MTVSLSRDWANAEVVRRITNKATNEARIAHSLSAFEAIAGGLRFGRDNFSPPTSLLRNVRAVNKTVAVCSSSPETRYKRNRQTSARKSRDPTGAGHSSFRTRTSRDPLDRNGVPPASRPYIRRPE